MSAHTVNCCRRKWNQDFFPIQKNNYFSQLSGSNWLLLFYLICVHIIITLILLDYFMHNKWSQTEWGVISMLGYVPRSERYRLTYPEDCRADEKFEIQKNHHQQKKGCNVTWMFQCLCSGVCDSVMLLKTDRRTWLWQPSAADILSGPLDRCESLQFELAASVRGLLHTAFVVLCPQTLKKANVSCYFANKLCLSHFSSPKWRLWGCHSPSRSC